MVYLTSCYPALSQACARAFSRFGSVANLREDIMSTSLGVDKRKVAFYHDRECRMTMQ